MSSQYIFTMYKLSRVHPPDKRVLEDISLSFLPGAKIGVLGPNGAGKSTLLRIMAGRDAEFRGDAQLAPGATVGLLEQEPQLDPDKDVRGNVEDGVRELRDMLDRFNELAANYSDDRPASSPGSRTRSTQPTRGTSTRRSRSPWTRCACRPAMPTSRRSRAASAGAWRSVACS
jgi:ATPase subunit of ABC transporter with duplicated ATPase domains